MDTSSSLYGYPRLANLMSVVSETRIFRKFNEVALLNILRLQAELQDMEGELASIIVADRTSGNDVRRECSLEFKLMRDFLETEDVEQQSLQYEQIEEMGRKLHEYNQAISDFLQLQHALPPAQRDLDFLRKWLDRPDGGNAFLRDREKKTWTQDHDGDFMLLSSRQVQIDPFTSLLKGILLDIYHRVWGHRKHDQTDYREYGEKKLARVSTVIVTVLASALPAMTVLVLYFVKRLLVRIGLIIVFTSLFSLALAIFTTADKVNIFTATATFAAVEVVFVGSTDAGLRNST
ncbi:hypothetical protein CKM354_000463200 [Cercospora kikuchii]|uniref:DUF6594 domain-containing protein n=1 Tax=Cercospora kikuchii TaxID=84275 RepID=A0A9P3FGC3_9PEZI|nr:uncharacterized protein CKM354_000463200 [Cercospora kikuchii]GIZ41325.1 hypothetical protein CKM354_000463200 [Cercospora kikuchii]